MKLYQIHFESNQIKNKSNGSNVSIFEQVLSESEGVTNYFKEELMGMAKDFKKGLENNRYLDYLIQFGFAESLFEMLDADTPDYKIYENKLMEVIALKFGFQFPFDPEIKVIDKALVRMEWEKMVETNDKTFKCLTPLQAKKEFLRVYYELCKCGTPPEE